MKIQKVSEGQKSSHKLIGLLLSQRLRTGPCGPSYAFWSLSPGEATKFESRASDSDKIQFTMYEAHFD